MSLVMKIDKILCGTAIGVAGLMALVMLLDLAIKWPFDRFSITSNIFVLIAAGLIIWQGLETWWDL